MPVISYSYQLQHRRAQCSELSYAEQIGLRTVDDLRIELKHEPEVDLLAMFPKYYARRVRMATTSIKTPSAHKYTDIKYQPQFRTRLDIFDCHYYFPAL